MNSAGKVCGTMKVKREKKNPIVEAQAAVKAKWKNSKIA